MRHTSQAFDTFAKDATVLNMTYPQFRDNSKLMNIIFRYHFATVAFAASTSATEEKQALKTLVSGAPVYVQMAS
jgi:hypothetical protein